MDHTAFRQSQLDPRLANRHWTREEVESLINLPFSELVYRAQAVHRENFDPTSVQLSTLLSIKTGGCSEDCGYCPQAARYHTGIKNHKLVSLDTVTAEARAAKENGATRFCMGAAWRGPKQADLDQVLEMVKAVKSLGLESCVTLGMLNDGQAEQLKNAGLDYYNHNLDTAPDYYENIISTHTQADRLDTLNKVQSAGINVCCGGIVGMGETRSQRATMIAQLANLNPYPKSVPINNLVQVAGTPLTGTEDLDPLEFVRTIACARITMPKAMVRLSAGRQQMPDAIQALCFLAGANSVFFGEKLLTTDNPQTDYDLALFKKLGMKPVAATS
jgi:biotin synthase